MNTCELTASITAIANTLACKLNRDELAYWGIVLSQLGQTMASIAAIQELCQPNDPAAQKESTPQDSASLSQLTG